MKTIYRTLLAMLVLFCSQRSLAQTPVLNSNPGSDNTLFLDFDGHLVQGTYWDAGTPIPCGSSGLNAEQIVAVFNRVAEDYRPFTVNVTTDSTRYANAPANRRTRVILTVSSSWYGNAGGVAFINSFSAGEGTPCFVFTALLGYSTKMIAEATSHELGHTLGLRHQSAWDNACNKLSEYNAGTGSGEIGWAPIMGNSYNRNMTLWNYGTNPYGCNNFQDDLSLITSADNGVTYRTDDYTHNLQSAPQMRFSNGAFEMAGLIERPADVDAIEFRLQSGAQFKAEALPYSIAAGNTGANIDLMVELLDRQQRVIGLYNPAASLSATIDTFLSSGTYYLRVQGTGNQFAPDYASLGSYTIKASAAGSTPLPLRKLLLNGMAEKDHHRLWWEIDADEAVVNQVVESSADGLQFRPVATPATGSRNQSIGLSGNLQYYRLAVTFDNGRQYYSNVVALRNTGNHRPALLGNVVTSSLRVNSPSLYTYTITDMSGRVVGTGNLRSGLNYLTPNLTTKGVYLIRYSNGQDHFSEKFSRQ